jgi:hypothetical protein
LLGRWIAATEDANGDPAAPPIIMSGRANQANNADNNVSDEAKCRALTCC